MSVKDLNIFQRCLLEILWVFCWIFGHLPHFVHYWIAAPIICFFIQRVLGYRRKVIDKNLARSFPKKSLEERDQIRNKFYVVLSEVMVGSIALSNRDSGFDIFPTIEEESDDPDRATLLREATRGRSWIALTAHFGSWEYFVMWSRFADQRTLAVYHPLKNPVSEALFKRLRDHYKVHHVPAKESLRFMMRHGLEYDGESYVLGLLADQNPPLLPDSHWFNFLGQETIFFEGGEKIARRLKLPVFFAYLKRVGRGRYEFCGRPLWDGVEELGEAEITSRYVEMLESIIRKYPEMWLWSHRRWKVQRDVKVLPWMEALKRDKE